MFSYNKLYKNNLNAWGGEIASLIKRALKYIKPKSKGLDLGCGQGKETIYLTKLGFDMSAIDVSAVAIKQIKNEAQRHHLRNIKAVQADISAYSIKKDKYDFIICLNLLHFLNRKKAKGVINEIKQKLAKGGVVIISTFTQQDPSFRRKKRPFGYYFKKKELLNTFKKFKILYYFEGQIIDRGHAGKLQPHKHGITSLIAQKH